MITSLTIRGLGPHADTTIDLDPHTPTAVRGASESGKSTLVHALSWLLWGTDAHGSPLAVEAIHDDATACEVAATTVRGTVLSRRMTRTRKISRQTTPPGGDPLTLSSEDRWSASLGQAGDAELGRAILTPDAWLTMAQGPGGGRPLRDLLERVLPGPTADEVMARHEVPEALRTEKAAAAHRRDARKAADQADGALASLREQLDAAQASDDLADLTDDDATEAARQKITAYEQAVAAHREAAEAHREWQRAQQAHEAGQAQLADWRRRRDALAEPDRERPTDEDDRASRDALTDAAERVVALQATAGQARVDAALERDAQSAERDAERAQAALDSLPERAACAGESGCVLAARGDAERQRLQDQHSDAVTRLSEARAALQADTERRAREISDAEAALLAAREAADDAQAARQAIQALAEAWRTYEAAAAALGDEPDVPDAPGPEPEVGDAPSDPTDARRALRDAEARRAAARAAVQRVEELQSRVDEAEARATRCRGAAEQADRHLQAVRSAPGEALGAKLAGLDLTDTGVALAVPEDGGAIEMTIDGRPWTLASHGRRIAASAGVRHALRVAARMPWMPIAVDDAQAWSGPLDIPAPCLLLTTTDGPLVVTSEAP